ncbi:DUF4190 domain-containing protein [Streptomyces sp. NPDC051569]|uniref:DUF4190 domain-containing protein n=1 Tax=Streptomyces sp. NPDC051569 TaxID=3365661 RepID=UPI0037A6A918
MSEKSEPPVGGYEPSDPWAPPQDGVELGKPAAQPGSYQQPQPTLPQQPVGSVHDQPTVIGTPGAVPGSESGGAPPPPTAPGGPGPHAPGPYGYPSAPPVQSAPSTEQSAAPGAAGYGYPGPGPAYPGYPAAGYPAAGYPGYGQAGWQPQQQPANGLGVAAMVLGILSVCLFCLYGIGGVVLGVLALIFGVLGRKRVAQGQATNGGQARAGIILGSIGIVIGLVVAGLLVWGITMAVNESDNSDPYDDYSTSLVTDVIR